MSFINSCRVSQLQWSIAWDDCHSPSEQEKEVRITFCKKERAYKILEGSSLLMDAIERREEFITVTFVHSQDLRDESEERDFRRFDIGR